MNAVEYLEIGLSKESYRIMNSKWGVPPGAKKVGYRKAPSYLVVWKY